MRGDDTLGTPLASASPAAIPSAISSTIVLSVLSPQQRLQRDERLLLAVNTGLYGFIFALQLLTILTAQTKQWQMLILFSSVMVLNLTRLIALRLAARPIPIEVYEDGLRWRIGRERLSLPWSEARGWCVLFLPTTQGLSWGQGAGGVLDAVYTVIGERTSLTWLYQPQPAQAAQASQTLAALVNSRVGLPLRDMSQSAARLSAELQGRPRRERALAVAPAKGASPKSRAPSLPAAVILVFVSILIVLAAILMPFAQQPYYGAQLQQLEAAQPQIRDPLTSDTLGWKPGPLDAAKSLEFTSDGYVFTSTACCDSNGRIPGVVGDGLVEITVHQQVDFDLNRAGLLFRANPATHTALVFAITPSAEWLLLRFTLGDDGSLSHERELRYEGVIFGVGAIHRGLDATNRLAVLMQGSSYTFFINGQFVGGYRANDLPQSGRVGIYAGGMNGPITFSDLLLSPTLESV